MEDGVIGVLVPVGYLLAEVVGVFVQLLGVKCHFRHVALRLLHFEIHLLLIRINSCEANFLFSEFQRPLRIEVDIGLNLVGVPREKGLSRFLERKVLPLKPFFLLESKFSAFYGLLKLLYLLLLFVLSSDFIRDNFGDLEGEKPLADREQQKQPGASTIVARSFAIFK